jgi:hypothetical protein
VLFRSRHVDTEAQRWAALIHKAQIKVD